MTGGTPLWHGRHASAVESTDDASYIPFAVMICRTMTSKAICLIFNCIAELHTHTSALVTCTCLAFDLTLSFCWDPYRCHSYLEDDLSNLCIDVFFHVGSVTACFACPRACPLTDRHFGICVQWQCSHIFLRSMWILLQRKRDRRLPLGPTRRLSAAARWVRLAFDKGRCDRMCRSRCSHRHSCTCCILIGILQLKESKINVQAMVSKT